MKSLLIRGMLVLVPFLAGSSVSAGAALEAGEGVVDISPPLGTPLGGYRYRDPAKPRVSTGIGVPPEARALVLRREKTTVAIISLDMLNVSFAMTRKVQEAVEKQTGIPAAHVRICATHSHTMPSIAFNRHWGDNDRAYEATVEKALIQAVRQALSDLAPAELRVGSALVIGGNRNRTLVGTEKARTETAFDKDATDAERWLDTKLRLLVLERKDRPALVWYHFSAHPTALGGSTLAGAEWPGLVQRMLRNERKLSPSYLQGHIGDVAPIGSEPTARAVVDAIVKALDNAKTVTVDQLRVETRAFGLALDIDNFKQQIARLKPDAEAGKLDAYNKDWYDNFASKYDLEKKQLPITLAAVRIGSVGMLFHPAELYSYYGLAIQRDSPLAYTFVVGYADGYVGYLVDPKAYQRGEYAARMVPTILNYPPFTPNAAREMTQAAVELLRKIAE